MHSILNKRCHHGRSFPLFVCKNGNSRSLTYTIEQQVCTCVRSTHRHEDRGDPTGSWAIESTASLVLVTKRAVRVARMISRGRDRPVQSLTAMAPWFTSMSRLSSTELRGQGRRGSAGSIAGLASDRRRSFPTEVPSFRSGREPRRRDTDQSILREQPSRFRVGSDRSLPIRSFRWGYGHGLAMPHSPRIHGGQVWLLDSGTGGQLPVRGAQLLRRSDARYVGLVQAT